MNQDTEAALRRFFTDHDWNVDVEAQKDRNGPDLELRKGTHWYLVEVMAAPEARSDRVIALLSQAILQAQTYVKNRPGARPFALVHVKELPDALVNRVSHFVAAFAPNVAIGLFGGDGRRYFEGDGLSNLTKLEERPVSSSFAPAPALNLFSDLNQWMLKVLLSPDVPVEMLSAPRDPLRSGTELAKAAGVSTMSVSRFLTTLRKEGFLAPGRPLKLVRREELFRRWQASVVRTAPEQAFRYLVPGAEDLQLRKFTERYRDDVCIGLFRAAEAFGLGHVSGVTPHVYVRDLSSPADEPQWKGIRPVREGEKPGIILRQSLVPESVFRGAVIQSNALVTDVIQVWLDVASHPSRGREQAALLESSVLRDLIGVSA